MVGECIPENYHVVQVDKSRAPAISRKQIVMGTLKFLQCIEKLEGHALKLLRPRVDCECRFMPIAFGDIDLPVFAVAVEDREVRRSL